ncbi:MAG TPA: helix-turn-helix domain-containing protein [Sphingomonas sp.]|uniref:GlxA family transcriptional regulator n=1 Tax=Sphingomonas sp. TaxID=28214 RepID=UPI002D129888|nr:helix-turn-helix domain-containing protein [Sphingomonas sp.]HMI19164.1 helix-turn-helix domain-containing protein [Sphingomonas sp.]
MIMSPIAKPARRPAMDVAIVMFDDGLSSTAVMPTEILHSAGSLWNTLHDEPTHPGFRVRTVSVDGKPVHSPYGFEITPGASIDTVDRADIIIVPTSGLDVDLKLVENSALLPWLRRHHEQGAYIVGVCMGSTYLAAAGLLDGRMATTHWAVADDMVRRYPNVRWHPELFVTEDQRILCSGGVGSAIDISLYLVEKFCGHEVALHTAKALLLPMPRLHQHQSGYAVLPVSQAHDNERIRAIEAWLQKHFNEDISIQSLADRACMSERTFVRHFKAATGRLPAAYIQALRIEASKVMLEHEGRSVQTIAASIGYNDVAFFRCLFKRATGMTPQQYRASFAPISVRGHTPPEFHTISLGALAN